MDLGRPQPSRKMDSGDVSNLRQALTPGLAALIDRSHARSINQNCISPHLLQTNLTTTHNSRSHPHHHFPSTQPPHTQARSESPSTEGFSDLDENTEGGSGMESSTSQNMNIATQRKRRAEVDLTSGQSYARDVMSYQDPRRRRLDGSEVGAGPSNFSKRRRTSTSLHIDRTRTIDQVDLINDDDDSLSQTLQNQRAEQVRAQQGQEGQKATRLGNLTCTVCLDTPKDLTVTSCGHAFCRDCLLDWLSAGEKQHPKRSNCPACRKTITRTKKMDVIPLEIMVKPRKAARRPSGDAFTNLT